MKKTKLPDIDKYPHLKNVTKAYTDGKYIVYTSEYKYYEFEGLHLRIFRKNKKKITDFSVLQEIKNEVVGIFTSAFQVFPRECDLIDNSNTYHLFTHISPIPNLKWMYKYKE